MERILRRAYATPKALVQRAAEFNGSGGPVTRYTKGNLALTKSR
jgi:hypothetical protein